MMVLMPTYLPLAAPHADLCLAPSLPTDAADQTRILNDPAVYMALRGPPFPFERAMADDWIEGEGKRWKDGSFWPAPSAIRRISDLELASPPFLGTITLSTSPFEHVADDGLRARLIEGNRCRPAGDKRWDVGFYVDPTQAGKGIMTAAFKTLLAHAVACGIPERNIAVSAFSTNGASLKVQRNLGYRPRYIRRAALVLASSKGGDGRPIDVVCSFAACVGPVGSGDELGEERDNEVEAFAERFGQELVSS